MTYDATKNKLIHSFSGQTKILENYSQAYQDLFVLSMLDGKTNGRYVEIGAYDAKIFSNTFILESIFNWWLDIYKNQEAWETCLGLLKVRKRIPLKNLIESESLKGNSKKWAIKIETLHTYVPSSVIKEKLNDPMWE